MYQYWAHSISHKGIPIYWLPLFIPDALNIVIVYKRNDTTKSRYRSIETLYCQPSLEPICLKIQYASKTLQGIMLHKVSEALLPMDLGASISPTWLMWCYNNLDAVVTALHNARLWGAGNGKGKLGVDNEYLICDDSWVFERGWYC